MNTHTQAYGDTEAMALHQPEERAHVYVADRKSTVT